MKYRVVVYQARAHARDSELLKQIQSLTGEESRLVSKLLASSPVNYFPDLEPGQAESLLEVFRKAGVNAEREPQDLAPNEKDWFVSESLKWVKRGLVMPYQLPAIYRHYRLELPPGILGAAPVKEKKSLIQNILTIGAVLVGLGIILFIASNWQKIPPSVKILASTFLSGGLLQAGGAFLRRGNEKFGQTLSLISFFAIGGTIALIGQIYHVRADSYSMPLLWAALVFPAAVLLASEAGLILAGCLCFLAGIQYQEQFQIGGWFFPPAIVMLTLASHRMKCSKSYALQLFFFGLSAVLSLIHRDFLMSSVWAALAGFLCLWKKDERYEIGWLAVWVLWCLSFVFEHPSVPNVIYLLPLLYFTVLGLRRESTALLSLNFLNMAVWLSTLFYALEKRQGWPHPGALDILLFGSALGALAYGTGMRLRAQAKWKELSDLFSYGGVLVLTVLSYILSFRFYTGEAVFFKSMLYACGSLIFWVFGAYMAARALLEFINKDARRWDELALLLGAAFTFFFTLVVSPAAGLHVLLYNVYLFMLSLVLMVKGYREQKIVYYHAGIAAFIGLIFSRYFDSLVEYIPKSLFFVLGGLFLIGWAVFIDREKKRFQPSAGGKS